MVGPMAKKSVWILITLFPIFVFITQFSDFWVMSYANWKHILGVFNFYNSVSNGILVIKHTWRDLLVRVSCNFFIFFSKCSFFFFFFSSFSLLSIRSSFFFVLHHIIFLVFAQFFLSFSFFFLLSLVSIGWVFFFFIGFSEFRYWGLKEKKKKKNSKSCTKL